MADVSAGPVLSRVDGPVLTLTLNRPERLNAVSQELYDGLIAELKRAGETPAIRCVLLTGAGRAFCAGADLKAHAERPMTVEERARYTASAQEANRLLQLGTVPVVAAVNGPAVGGGLELALSSDFMIVADDAKLRLPEVALGTFIGGGVSYTLVERVGALKARELVYLGDFFLGSEAAELGIANVAVPAADVLSTARAWAERLAELAPLSLSAAKSLIGPAGAMSREEALDRERIALERIFGSADWREGVDAYREGRPPRYRGE